MSISRLKNILFIVVFFCSCTIKTFVTKEPKNKPYLIKNDIELKGGNFSNTEKESVLQRLSNQLDDSSKIPSKDAFFILHFVKKPPAYDTSFTGTSARNMRSSMYHLGYYDAKVFYTQDTSKKRRVSVKYIVEAGRPTLIDTLSYRFSNPSLKAIALASKNEALLVKNNPVTKAAVLGEISRLVDTFRNNGYYKFTAAELSVKGDSSIAALTSISDDPFEQLRLLQEAQQKKDSPQVKLAIILNKPDDSTKLNSYVINKIYILSDFRPSDNLNDTVNINQKISKNKSYILRYHDPLFRTSVFARNVTLKTGDVYRQREYYNTLNNLNRLGVWQSVNIRLVENLDDTNKVDIVMELITAKKFGFDASPEASYAYSGNNNNSLAGNLFGISANLSLLNRNIGREAIKMTHSLRYGVELNNRNKSNTPNAINSNELSYSNNVVIQRLLTPIKRWNNKKLITPQTFINLNLSQSNRFNLFTTKSLNLNYGVNWVDKKRRSWSVRFPNVEFSNLNPTDSFNTILANNPFLRYSYNTAFVAGTVGGVSKSWIKPAYNNVLSRERILKINAEESGLTWGALLPIPKKFKRKFLKIDIEFRSVKNFKNNKALAFRAFTGVGIPLFKDSIPFFKQYFGGGSTSMRGWPVRGIGRGGQKLAPFSTSVFNDRTGDMQLELNEEFRYNIARLIPNLLTLKGAIFIDAGNVWNLKDSRPGGITDSTQFKFKNLWKEFGISAGTGLRLDFNYLVLRLDLGFRFKRPETSYINNGWKAPSIGFDDAFKKIFSRNYREWRYENFNFTIGINYPF